MLLSIKVVIYHAQANHQAWRSVSANLPTIDEEFEIHIQRLQRSALSES
jgi:hypothetical protein